MVIPLRVLLLEDEGDYAGLVLSELKRFGYAPVWLCVRREEDFQAGLAWAPEIIIAEYTADSSNALQALHIVRAQKTAIPFIIVSSVSGEEIAVAAMRQGADDYLRKDRLARLGEAVANAIEKYQILQQERDQQMAAEISEKRYRQISELISEYAYALSVQPDGTLVQEWVTDAYARITGYSPEELNQAGRWRQVVHPDDQDRVNAHVDYVQSGQRAVCEYRILTRQGDVRWLQDFSYFFEDESSGRPMVLGAAQDITERKQAEEALRQQESLLRSVLDALPVGVWIADRAGQINFGNPAGKRIWHGARYVDPQGYHEYKGWSLDTGKRIEPDEWALSRALALGKAIIDEEVEIESFDGSHKIILNSAVPLRDGNGQITGAIVVNQEITERKRAQEEIQQGKLLLQIAGEAARLGGWIVDLATETLIWSDEICAIHEVPAGTAPTIREALSYFPAEWRAKFVAVMKACINTGTPFDEELQITTARGRRLWVRAIGKAVYDANGAITQVQGALQDITERKRAAEQVNRLATQVTTTLESITEAFFMLDRAWRFTYMNKVAEELLQRKRSELLGKVVWDEFREAVEHKFYPEYHRAMRDNCPVTFVEKYAPLDVWLEVHAYPSEEGLAVYFRDVSERRQAEAALQQRLIELEALHSVSSALRVALTREEVLPVLLDKTLAALNTDVGAIRLFAPDRGVLYTAVARGWCKELDDVLVKPGEGIAGAVFATRQTYRFADFQNDPTIAPHMRAQTPPHWSGACVPILVGNEAVGVISAILPHPQEITPEQVKLLESLAEIGGAALHRVRLWQEIQEQTRHIHSIMDTAPTGMLLLDIEGRVHLANPEAERHLDVLTKAGALSPDGRVLSHLGDRRLADLLAPPAKGQRHEIQVGDQTFEVIARPMTQDPTPSQWVLLLDDVTAERNRQHYEQIQDRLATVGQLAAGIAHDFNNIMGVIVLYAGMLHNAKGLSDRQRAQVSTIYAQAEHAANLIRQILDFSRRSILHLAPMDLLPLMKELVKLLGRTLPEHIQVELVYDHNEYVVNADPTRLQQALMNLAINARDAMQAGGRLQFDLSSLTVGPDQPPLPDMEPGHWLQMKVTDTGSGILPEHLEHIFEPFFTTKAAGEGTGLGLAQVYGIVKQHAGEIDVESQVGQGSTFTIYLPLLAEPADETDLTLLDRLALGRGETILLVEDNQALQETIADMLQELGYCVLAADDGVVALQILAEKHDTVALVLTDLVMPNMGGLDLYNRLLSDYPQLKRIFMTGYAPEEEAYRELRLRGEALLQKPFSATDLAAGIEAVLANAALA